MEKITSVNIKCVWCGGDLEVVPAFILSRDVTLATCPTCSYEWLTIPREQLDEIEEIKKELSING